MADSHFTFTLDLRTAPRVFHHVVHDHLPPGTSSWRVDSDAIYLTGTVDELRAFGYAIIEAADARSRELAEKEAATWA
jgi:hypothetical protein